jgi:hypothetical protein
MVVYQRSRAFAPSKPASRPPRFPKDTPVWWIENGAPPWQFPAVITDRADIEAIAHALNHLDDARGERMTLTGLLVLVQDDGRVKEFRVSDARCQEIGIDYEHKSSMLSSALSKAIPRSRPVGLVLEVPMDTVSLVGGDGTGTISVRPTSDVEKMIRELLTCWSPYDSIGSHVMTQSRLAEVARYLSPRVTIGLGRSAMMEALLRPPFRWTPEEMAQCGRVQQLRYDTIEAIREGRGSVFLAFVDTESGTCLVTNRVCSLKILRDDPAKPYPDYGPDLFDALVSAVRASKGKQ